MADQPDYTAKHREAELWKKAQAFRKALEAEYPEHSFSVKCSDLDVAHEARDQGKSLELEVKFQPPGSSERHEVGGYAEEDFDVREVAKDFQKEMQKCLDRDKEPEPER